MFVNFVLILESSCSFRLKFHQLVLGVIIALTFNTVGFHGDDCQVSPVRSLKTLFRSQSLLFLEVAILLVTRQHNIWPYCWSCATTGSVAQLHPRMSSITLEQCSTMTNQPLPFHSPTTPAPFVFDNQSKVLYVRLQYGSLLPYEIQEWDIHLSLLICWGLCTAPMKVLDWTTWRWLFVMTGYWDIFCPMSSLVWTPFWISWTWLVSFR
jgi:hypothetical protein